MPDLRSVFEQHLKATSTTARACALAAGVPYPVVLGALNKGTVPRDPAQREALRKQLGLDQDAWAALVAASMGVELPAEGPLTLQQLVLKRLLLLGHSERSFAQESGLPYALVTGITRKGAVPRPDGLQKLAAALELGTEELEHAVARARSGRRGGSAPAVLAAVSHQGPALAQLTADAVRSSGLNIAAFAKKHRIPYVSLARLLGSGVPPRRQAALAPLQQALGLDDEGFAAALASSKLSPEPPAAAPEDDVPGASPLQAALIQLVKERRWTTKDFCKAADLSPLTGSRLLKGDLPGRSATHAKLRGLLGLDEEAYQALIGGRAAEPPAPSQDEPAGDGASSPAAAQEDDLIALVGRLTPEQRTALQAFLGAML